MLLLSCSIDIIELLPPCTGDSRSLTKRVHLTLTYSRNSIRVSECDASLRMFGLLLGSQFPLIDLEKMLWLCWMLPSHIVESRGGDVVSLALLHKAVVLKKILLLRRVKLGLGLKDSLGFGTGGG